MIFVGTQGERQFLVVCSNANVERLYGYAQQERIVISPLVLEPEEEEAIAECGDAVASGQIDSDEAIVGAVARRFDDILQVCHDGVLTGTINPGGIAIWD